MDDDPGLSDAAGRSGDGPWSGVAFGVWCLMALGIGAVAMKHVNGILPMLFVLGMIVFAVTSRLAARSKRSVPSRRRPPSRAPAGPEVTFDMACPNCGAQAAGEDVSPGGEAKCRSCGGWFGTRRK